MSTRDQALELIRSLPEDCTWQDVIRAVAERAAGRRGAGREWGKVAELRAGYGPAEPTPADGEAGMTTREYDVVIERDTEGFYVASVPALRGCHTQARSLDVLYERVREAIALAEEVSGGKTTGTEFVGVRRFSASA